MFREATENPKIRTRFARKIMITAGVRNRCCYNFFRAKQLLHPPTMVCLVNTGDCAMWN